ncbi:MAG: hypothetical protein ACP5IX_03525, partial [Patescibacteria group bacterium]
VGLIVHWLIGQFSRLSIFVNFIITALSAIVFQLFFLIINQVLYWLRITQWPIIFNREYFNQIGFFIVLNTLIIFLINQICLSRSKSTT